MPKSKRYNSKCRKKVRRCLKVTRQRRWSCNKKEMQVNCLQNNWRRKLRNSELKRPKSGSTILRCKPVSCKSSKSYYLLSRKKSILPSKKWPKLKGIPWYLTPARVEYCLPSRRPTSPVWSKPNYQEINPYGYGPANLHSEGCLHRAGSGAGRSKTPPSI